MSQIPTTTDPLKMLNPLDINQAIHRLSRELRLLRAARRLAVRVQAERETRYVGGQANARTG